MNYIDQQSEGEILNDIYSWGVAIKQARIFGNFSLKNRKASRFELAQINNKLIEAVQLPENWHNDFLEIFFANYEPKNVSVVLSLIQKWVSIPKYESLVRLGLDYIALFPNKETKVFLESLATTQQYTEFILKILTKETWVIQEPYNIQIYSTPNKQEHIEGKITLLQTRPGGSEIFVITDKNLFQVWLETKLNKKYEGYVDFPDPIENWCLKATGDEIFFVSSPDQKGFLWSLVTNKGTKVSLPFLREISDLRYMWNEEGFWLRGGFSPTLVHLILQDNQIGFQRSILSQVSEIQYGWYKATNQMPIYKCQALKVDCHLGQILFYSAQESKIGIYNWKKNTEWLVPVEYYFNRVAFFDSKIYLLHEDRVHAVNQSGKIEDVFYLPQNYYGQDLDIVYGEEGKISLVIACNSLNQINSALLIVYYL